MVSRNRARRYGVKPFVVRFFAFKAHAPYRDSVAFDKRLHSPQHRHPVFLLNFGNSIDPLTKLRGGVLPSRPYRRNHGPHALHQNFDVNKLWTRERAAH